MTTIIPTDNDCQISGRLVRLHLPSESNPRCSVELAEVDWELGNSTHCKDAILVFQCPLRGKDSLNVLPLHTLETLVESILNLKYTGNHRINGSLAEIDAMSIALRS